MPEKTEPIRKSQVRAYTERRAAKLAQQKAKEPERAMDRAQEQEADNGRRRA